MTYEESLKKAAKEVSLWPAWMKIGLQTSPNKGIRKMSINENKPPLGDFELKHKTDYLEDGEITDDLLQKHGRLPCEVSSDRNYNNSTSMHSYLAIVTSGTSEYKFITADGEDWPHCRIKKSDLDESK